MKATRHRRHLPRTMLFWPRLTSSVAEGACVNLEHLVCVFFFRIFGGYWWNTPSRKCLRKTRVRLFPVPTDGVNKVFNLFVCVLQTQLGITSNSSWC